MSRNKKANATYTIGIVNSNVCTAGIVDQLLHEGHSVKMFVAIQNTTVDDGQGLGIRYPKTFKVINVGHFYSRVSMSNPLIKSCLTELANCDFIMFDYDRESIGVEMATYLRGTGVPVIGPTDFSLNLEMGRPFGKEQAAKSGLKNLTLTYQAFSSEDALKAVSRKGFGKKPFLIKGDAITVKPMSYDDGLDFLSQPYSNTLLGTPLFIEQVVPGHFEEIAFSLFFNGTDFLSFSLVNREYKGIYNEGRGNIMCGEAGTACEFVYTSDLPPLIKAAADGIKEQLSISGYRGQVDLNTLWSDSECDFHFLEWTCRSGIPTEHIIATAMGASGRGYGNHLAHMCNLTKEWVNDIVTGEKIIAVALQYQVTQADYNSIHAPMVPNLQVKKTGLTPLKVDGGDSRVSLLNGAYYNTVNNKMVIRSSKILPERTAIVIALGSSYERCVNMLDVDLPKVCPWSHHYRTDVGNDLLNVGSLLDVVL